MVQVSINSLVAQDQQHATSRLDSNATAPSPPPKHIYTPPPSKLFDILLKTFAEALVVPSRVTHFSSKQHVTPPFNALTITSPYHSPRLLFNQTLKRAQTVTFTINSKQAKQVASSKRHLHDCSTWRSHEEHVIRTCFIDLWFGHVILGLVQEIHQLAVKFALFSLYVLHEQNWIFTRFCLVVLLFVLIYPFLFK